MIAVKTDTMKPHRDNPASVFLIVWDATIAALAAAGTERTAARHERYTAGTPCTPYAMTI